MSKFIGDIAGVALPYEMVSAVASLTRAGTVTVTASSGRVVVVGASSLHSAQARSLAEMLEHAADESQRRLYQVAKALDGAERMNQFGETPLPINPTRDIAGVAIPPELLVKGLPGMVTVLASLGGVELVGECSLDPEQARSLAEMLEHAAIESQRMETTTTLGERSETTTTLGERSGACQTYKLVKGTIDELEGLLNAVVAEGYTQLFREFPPLPNSRILAALHDPTRPAPPEVYAFMMKKHDPNAGGGVAGIPSPEMVRQYASVLRELIGLLGFPDRIPFPTGGSQAPS